MKRLGLLLTIFLILEITNAQEGPQLQLTGNSSFVKKGSIDTELLTAIIQKKQDEIKQRVFRNTIIRYFKDNSYTESLNNFTTYNYMYNLMDVLTSGKNKTVMTKSLIRNSADFAFAYGLTYYMDKKLIDQSITNFEEVSNSRQVTQDVVFMERRIDTKAVFEFNLRVDLTYKLLLEMQDEFANYFTFENSTKNKYFEEWHKHDNKYDVRVRYVLNRIKEIEASSTQNQKSKDELISLKEEKRELDNLMNSRRKEIQSFLILVNKLEDAYSMVENQLNNEDNTSKDSLELKYHLKQDFLFESNTPSQKFRDAVRLDKAINSLKEDLTNNLKKDKSLSGQEIISLVNEHINHFKDFYANNSEEIKNILNFFNQLRKSNFKDFSLTKNQYDAMKFILKEFISLARNKFDEKDVISSVLSFLLENTLVEFTDKEGLSIAEKNLEDDKDEPKGYLYVDVASLITAIDESFGSIKRKRWLNYVSPFFSIGTNYASFNGSNNLLSNGEGGTEDLNNLYFASEKIGVKIKLWNWKYTHSFDSGEPIKYWFIDGNSWKRPQPEPIISDLYLTAYGSGILYNLIDVKSEKEFDYAIVGFGAGLTFFNGLSFNVSYASPIVERSLNDWFLNFGLDIPILEYIGALSKKNN